MKKYLLLTMASVCFGLIGCSDDAKEAVHNVRSEPDLQGSFTNACDNSRAAAQRTRLNFEGNGFTRSLIYYKNSDCTAETGRLEYKGEFVAGKQNKKVPTQGGTLDLNIQEAKMKVSAPEMARALNNIKYCGHTDFGDNKEITLNASSTCKVQAPAKLYTVYRLENDRLYFGDTDLGSFSTDKEQRSGAVNYSAVYVRDAAGDKSSNTQEMKNDIDKTVDEANDDVKKTYDEAKSDVKKGTEKAKSDTEKALAEAKDDTDKTVEQAKTDVKQAADKIDEEINEGEPRE